MEGIPDLLLCPVQRRGNEVMEGRKREEEEEEKEKEYVGRTGERGERGKRRKRRRRREGNKLLNVKYLIVT